MNSSLTLTIIFILKQRFNDSVINNIRIQLRCFKINIIKHLKIFFKTAYVSFTVHDDIFGFKNNILKFLYQL